MPTRPHEHTDHCERDSHKLSSNLTLSRIEGGILGWQGLLATDSAAVEYAELLKLVCKVFWSTTYMGIPPLLLQEAQFTGWMTCLLQAVQRPVPKVSPSHAWGTPSSIIVIPPAITPRFSAERIRVCAHLFTS